MENSPESMLLFRLANLPGHDQFELRRFMRPCFSLYHNLTNFTDV